MLVDRLLSIINKRRGLILGAIVVLLLLPLIFYFAFFYGKTVVEIVAAPSDVEVLINGEQGNNGTNWLRPGDYSINIVREGFETETLSISLGEERLTIPVILTPLTSEAHMLVIADSDRFFEVEALFGAEAQEEGERFREQNPIINHLPFRSLIFDIDYRLNDEDEVVLQITVADTRERDFALSQIHNWGFNPDDFEIEYRRR